MGKTATAIRMASLFTGEIVSADSMQIYKYMDIGTAKPTGAEQKQTPFALRLKEPVTVGEVAEILGIPLSEVDLVTVNGTPAGRSYRPIENDYIAIYPVFENLDVRHEREERP